MAKKRKAPNRNSKRRAPPPRTRRRAPPLAREIPLGQGLQAFAREGMQSLFWVGVAASVIAVAAALAVGLWTLRPILVDDDVEIGSPFDVTFQIRNTSRWFALSRPGIGCILARPGAPDLPPVNASDVRVLSGTSLRLEPGQSGTSPMPVSRRPFERRRTARPRSATALRSQIYFRTTYDLPFYESFRLTDDRGPFVLNTSGFFLPSGRPWP